MSGGTQNKKQVSRSGPGDLLFVLRSCGLNRFSRPLLQEGGEFLRVAAEKAGFIQHKAPAAVQHNDVVTVPAANVMNDAVGADLPVFA